MVDNDNYSIVTTLTEGRTYTLTGVSDFADWDVDRDFFERADVSDPETLTFLPMTGMYKVTANFKHSYLRIEAMKSATEYASLAADGSGNAIWTVGAGIGKPVIKNGDGWDMGSTGLCLARVADKKFQISLVAGVSINASNFDFKFFWPKDWDKGEFLGKTDASFANPYGVLTTTSDLIEISDGGNLGLAEGKTLDLGGIYRFTIDVSGGTMAAVLTVEKVGEQELPPADITVNGTPMAQLDVDNYQLDLDLTQGQTLTLGGADAFTPAWINPDFFGAASATSVKLVPVTGKYRITANLATRVIDALVLNADGSGLATLSDDGHGSSWRRRPRGGLFHRLRHRFARGRERTGLDHRKGRLRARIRSRHLHDDGPGGSGRQHDPRTAFPRERLERQVLPEPRLGRSGSLHAGAGRRGVLLDRRGRQHRDRLGSHP